MIIDDRFLLSLSSFLMEDFVHDLNPILRESIRRDIKRAPSLRRKK